MDISTFLEACRAVPRLAEQNKTMEWGRSNGANAKEAPIPPGNIGTALRWQTTPPTRLLSF